MCQKRRRFLLFLTLGQQVRALESRTKCQIQDDDADGGRNAVDEGDTAGDLGQSFCDGVLLTEDVDIAEIAEERVGDDVQQQAGRTSGSDLEQVAGAVAVEVTELEDLVCDGTAGDAMMNFRTKVVTA